MRVALIYPPAADPTAPYLSVPMLTGFLRTHGVDVLPVDANVEAFDLLLRPEPLRALRDRIVDRLRRLDARPSLDHEGQLDYANLFRALGDAYAVPEGIVEAVQILRDRERFFEPQHYARAVDTVDAALRVVSAAYAPLRLDFTGYRTPFALLNQDEIARDADAERDPFDAYVRHLLVPRLRDAAVDVIGLSVCFPGQLQPAYSFGLKLKAALPGVHLTVGGPAITQLLIRLRGPDLARGLGPFDSAVAFEGERTLLALVHALAARPDEDPAEVVTQIPNVIHRDRLQGAKYVPGQASEDLRELPAPDFTGLPLERYFAPHLMLPYDPTRGCYWGKCAFCHYGLTEKGTASYRERPVESIVAHLKSLSERYGTRHFYFSQDSVAPKTLVKLAAALADAQLDLRWATDLKPEKYLTVERAEILRRGGAVACALGVESGNERILGLIGKGAPVRVVSDVIHHLDQAGIAVEAMCFTGFPTETFAEAMQTLRFLEERRKQIAAFIVGEFDLTHGARVAQDPGRFGIEEIWQVQGDTFGTGLFYRERRSPRRGDEAVRLDGALDRLAAGWALRRYPWAGALSTAHSVLYYDRFGKAVARELASRTAGGVIGARPREHKARFDPFEAAGADSAEAEIWAELVYGRRRVSRADYAELAARLPMLAPRPRRYRVAAGTTPAHLSSSGESPKRRGRRPSNRTGQAGRGRKET
jgi:anaerobic magnesium-protoporphyrin IX monomethyl ester cyclase